MQWAIIGQRPHDTRLARRLPPNGGRDIWPDSPLVRPPTSPRILGRTVTSDAGLLLPRELDDRLGLNTLIERHLADLRTGHNRLFPLRDLFRQSILAVWGATRTPTTPSDWPRIPPSGCWPPVSPERRASRSRRRSTGSRRSGLGIPREPGERPSSMDVRRSRPCGRRVQGGSDTGSAGGHDGA